MATALIINDLRVLFIRVPVVGPCRMLQLGNRIRGPHMRLTPDTPGILATRLQHFGQDRIITKGQLMGANGLLGNFKDTNALDLAGRAREILINRVAINSNGLKDRRATVGHVGANAHLGHNF